MKNRIIILAAAISVLAVSCQKEEIPTPVVKTEPMVIAAGMETKTVLVGEKDILWTPGDIIMVLDNLGNKSEFKDENLTSNSVSANFVGNVTEGTTEFLAVYPSSSVASTSKFGETVVTIPEVQTPKVGSFETEYNISVAYGVKTPGTPNVGNVTFENIGGLLKFSLPTDLTNIASVSISSSSPIAGSVSVSPSENGISTEFTGNVKTITMNPGSGKTFTFEDGEVNTFWFALAPVSLNDITISVTTDKGYTYSMKKEWSSPLKIDAGTFKNLGTLMMKQATVVAQHTKNIDGQLNGTKLNITLPDNAENIVLNLKQRQEDVWSNINSLEVEGAETYTSYPYLPQGTYQLSGKYTIAGKGTEVQLGTTNVIVPAPEFTVTPAKAHTSYNLYSENNDVDGANACDGRTIYNLHNEVKASISSDILKKYGYKITTQTPDGEIVEATYQFGATSLGSKDITTNFTFDGVTVSSSPVTYHITGLPYKQLEEAGWQSNMDVGTLSQKFGIVVWNGNTVLLGNNSSWNTAWGIIKSKLESLDWNLDAIKLPSASDYASITKTFHIPSNIAVATTVSGTVVADKYSTGLFTKKYYYRSNTATITVGGGEDSVYSKSVSNSTADKNSPDEISESFTNQPINSIMSSNDNKAIIHNQNSQEDCRTTITNFTILYR